MLYTTARDVTSAAVRLDLLGPIEGASMLHGLRDLMQELAAEPHEQSWQIDPILDVIQGTHDSLYSRLFLS